MHIVTELNGLKFFLMKEYQISDIASYQFGSTCKGEIMVKIYSKINPNIINTIIIFSYTPSIKVKYPVKILSTPTKKKKKKKKTFLNHVLILVFQLQTTPA